MSLTWQMLAAAVADAWARPRVGGYPPIASLSFTARAAYWQAVNLRGFEGSEAAWYTACREHLPADCPHDAPEKYLPEVEARPAPRSALPAVPPPSSSERASTPPYVPPSAAAQPEPVTPAPSPPTPAPTPVSAASNPYGDDL